MDKLFTGIRRAHSMQLHSWKKKTRSELDKQNDTAITHLDTADKKAVL